jgi:hypothetical protein
MSTTIETSADFLKAIIDMIVLDINGLSYEPWDIVCPVEKWFMRFSQSDQWGIMYDLFSKDPRDEDNDDQNSIYGWLLECDMDESGLDVMDLISKVAFFLPDYPLE